MTKQTTKLKSAEEFLEQIQGKLKEEPPPESAPPSELALSSKSNPSSESDPNSNSDYSAQASFKSEEADSHSDSYEETRRCAHRIIRAREKTSHDLLKRLQEKGHNLEDSKRVVERFAEVGLVDDARYTELYIRGAQSANKGWQRIVQELRKRGISTDHLEPPLEEDELERASAVIQRLAVDTHKNREKALRRLLTKGFSYHIAKQAISARRGEVRDDTYTFSPLEDIIF